MSGKKVLCKKREDRKIAGVCAGIADYFDIDPTVVRIVWAALALVWGAGAVLYLIAAIVMPTEEN